MSFKSISQSLLLPVLVSVLAACGGSGGSSSSQSNSDQNDSGQPATNEPSAPDVLVDITGTVFTARDSGVDLDIEEAGNLVFEDRNNSQATAQFISNPVTLGGYLSGRDGVFSRPQDGADSYFKDLADVFQVTLIQDQSISLSVFYADEVDEANSRQVSVSLVLKAVSAPSIEIDRINFTGSSTQSILVPETQDYFIEVVADENVSVPTLYTLKLSETLASSASGSSQRAFSDAISSNFIPGEVLVSFKQKRAARAATSVSLANPEIKLKRSVGSKASLYQFNSMSDLQVSGASGRSAREVSSLTASKWQTLLEIEKLRERADVDYAEPNFWVSASTISSPADITDSLYVQQWNADMIGLPAAWQVATGNGVRVAVVDTGVSTTHADLDGNLDLADGYDFVSVVSIDGDNQSGMDSDPSDPGTTYHGAHVSGIIGAEGNSIGIRGVAYESTVIPLRALGINGVGSSADIANAILYSAGLSNSSGRLPSEPADILNLSLGTFDFSQTMQSAVIDAINEGVIVVAAVGNEASESLFYPAAFDGVIGVSSVNEAKELSLFSNRGSYVDVAAPGGTNFSNTELFDGFNDGILSTVYASAYGQLVGTSMAAPHVSGVLALMKELRPDLTPALAQSFLEAGSLTDEIDLLGVSEATERSYFGSGLINAAKAIGAAGGTVPDSLLVYPSQLGFLGGGQNATLSLQNPGTGSVVIESISADETWVNIQAQSINSSGLGTYLIEIEPTQLAALTIGSAEIDVSYRVNAGQIQSERIEIFVSRTTTSDDTVGNLNVFLVRVSDIEAAENTGSAVEVFSAVGAQLREGQYSYSFSDVPSGSYFIQAGTNNDGDAFVFDDGEARGAYPTLSTVEVVEVDGQSFSQMNFEVSYPDFSLESSSLSPLTVNSYLLSPSVNP